MAIFTKRFSGTLLLVFITNALLYGAEEELFTKPSSFKQKLSSYNQDLGVYTVDLKPTLRKITQAGDLNTLPLKADPYFQKVFGDNGDNSFRSAKKLLGSKKCLNLLFFQTEMITTQVILLKKWSRQQERAFPAKQTALDCVEQCVF